MTHWRATPRMGLRHISQVSDRNKPSNFLLTAYVYFKAPFRMIRRADQVQHREAVLKWTISFGSTCEAACSLNSTLLSLQKLRFVISAVFSTAMICVHPEVSTVAWRH
ncbi:hypothetical protein BV25DRAFT_770403 [Artomyces pyxidatus]|uniref:Uncharacterized protein n=1 Tax=Artomyces pyxidatus TaxID=48021 RepID=A0ACB8SYI2_9AGAM|nr:hypothetical protein BV25DRAFT_770403 [Artomyces pyxidatus]